MLGGRGGEASGGEGVFSGETLPIVEGCSVGVGIKVLDFSSKVVKIEVGFGTSIVVNSGSILILGLCSIFSVD